MEEKPPNEIPGAASLQGDSQTGASEYKKEFLGFLGKT